MKLWTYQKIDAPSLRTIWWGYETGSVLSIHRFSFLRWWWIWGRYTKPQQAYQKQTHNQDAEQSYMDRRPDIWPPGEDYSGIHADHHIKYWGVVDAAEELSRGEADNGSTGG